MAAHTVESDVTCPEGHGPDWLIKWDGTRADYLCCVCQSFFDVGVPHDP